MTIPSEHQFWRSDGGYLDNFRYDKNVTYAATTFIPNEYVVPSISNV